MIYLISSKFFPLPHIRARLAMWLVCYSWFSPFDSPWDNRHWKKGCKSSRAHAFAQTNHHWIWARARITALAALCCTVVEIRISKPNELNKIKIYNNKSKNCILLIFILGVHSYNKFSIFAQPKQLEISWKLESKGYFMKNKSCLDWAKIENLL